MARLGKIFRENNKKHTPDANSCKTEFSLLLQSVGNKAVQWQVRSIEKRQDIIFSLSCFLEI